MSGSDAASLWVGVHSGSGGRGLARGPRRRPLSSPPPSPPLPLDAAYSVHRGLFSIDAPSLLSPRLASHLPCPLCSVGVCVLLTRGRARSRERSAPQEHGPSLACVASGGHSAPLAHVVCNILVQFGRCAYPYVRVFVQLVCMLYPPHAPERAGVLFFVNKSPVYTLSFLTALRQTALAVPSAHPLCLAKRERLASPAAPPAPPSTAAHPAHLRGHERSAHHNGRLSQSHPLAARIEALVWA